METVDAALVAGGWRRAGSIRAGRGPGGRAGPGAAPDGAIDGWGRPGPRGRLRRTTGLLRGLERRRGPKGGRERWKRLSGKGFSGACPEIPSHFPPREGSGMYGTKSVLTSYPTCFPWVCKHLGPERGQVERGVEEGIGEGVEHQVEEGIGPAGQSLVKSADTPAVLGDGLRVQRSCNLLKSWGEEIAHLNRRLISRLFRRPPVGSPTFGPPRRHRSAPNGWPMRTTNWPPPRRPAAENMAGALANRAFGSCPGFRASFRAAW